MTTYKCTACNVEFDKIDELHPLEKACLITGVCPECGAEAIMEFPDPAALAASDDDWEDVP